MVWLIILLVLFVMTMFIWLLGLLEAVPQVSAKSNWLAFFACMILGVMVFLVGSGTVVWKSF